MKLRNRIMSWILSPGAYALWHSMGNSDEWTFYADRDKLRHASGLEVFVMNHYQFSNILGRQLGRLAVFVFGSFALDCCDEYEESIGYLDRHIIAGRVFRTQKKLARRSLVGYRQRRNMAVFKKLTVNE